MADDAETPMRERIARALLASLDAETNWYNVEEDDREFMRKQADAVLDAMREPNINTVAVALDVASLNDEWGIDLMNDFRRAWAAAIDAAKEGK